MMNRITLIAARRTWQSASSYSLRYTGKHESTSNRQHSAGLSCARRHCEQVFHADGSGSIAVLTEVSAIAVLLLVVKMYELT
jgi:hypothetical protein